MTRDDEATLLREIAHICARSKTDSDMAEGFAFGAYKALLFAAGERHEGAFGLLGGETLEEIKNAIARYTIASRGNS